MKQQHTIWVNFNFEKLNKNIPGPNLGKDFAYIIKDLF